MKFVVYRDQIYYFYVHIDLLMDCSFYMDTYGVSIKVKPFCAFITFSTNCVFFIKLCKLIYMSIKYANSDYNHFKIKNSSL